jgi:DNA-binding SARP family transcriptional activator
MLEVSLLGEQYVSGPSAANGGRSTRSIALLAWLALHAGVPQSRQLLAGVFWPDSTDAQARTNLRRELHQLRALLDGDGSLVADPTTLLWRDTETCRVDVRVFANHRAAALGATTPDDVLRHAGDAVAAYGGDLLPGLYDDWILEQRELLRRQCLDLVDRLVSGWQAAGDLEQAIGFARSRIRLAPLEEAGYRTLIGLQAENGERAGAISTYHQCAATLEQELGLDPSPETTRAFEQLLGRRNGLPPSTGRGRSTPAIGSVFVGRRAEREFLDECWRQAAAGNPMLVVVSGEAGVGKSRLVHELAASARDAGAVVATTRCFGMARRLALAPVADWLRSPEFARPIRELDPVWQTEVARLVPAAYARGSSPQTTAARATGAQPAHDRATSRSLAEAWRRHRFFEGLARAVLAARRPTLLVLDDLQWCDEETATWLTFLLGLADEAPLLVVMTARSEELDDNHEVARLINSLRSSGVARHVQLEPLPPDEVRELAGALLDRPLSDDEAALFPDATGGYPLYVVEAVRAGASPTGDAAAFTAGRDMGSVLRNRLGAASPDAREIAGLAASVGREFSLELLAEASDLDASAVVRAVDELWRRRILRGMGGDYDFSHDLVRESAYESVPPARRWLIHRRLAQSLELLYADRTDDVAAQLAEQYERGGRPDRARRYYRQAADQAARVFANAEAVRLFRKCLEMLSAPTGSVRDQQELDILLAMVPPVSAIHGFASPILQQTLERASKLAAELGRPTDVMNCHTGLFANAFVQGRIRAAHEFAAWALDLAEADPELAGQAHLAFAGSSTSLGMLREAERHFELARALSHDREPLIVGPLTEVHCFAWRAHAHWLSGDTRAAISSVQRAVETARAAEHPFSLAAALGYACTTFQFTGDVDQAAAAAAELVEVCDRYEFAWYVEWGHVVAGWATGGQAGIDRISQALTRLRAAGSYARMPYWLTLLADAHTRLGNGPAAQAILAAAQSMSEQNEERWWQPEVLRRHAAFCDRPTARRMLTRAVRMTQEQGSVVLLGRCAHDLTVLDNEPMVGTAL